MFLGDNAREMGLFFCIHQVFLEVLQQLTNGLVVGRLEKREVHLEGVFVFLNEARGLDNEHLELRDVVETDE